jgi:signal transduction histidine kinase
VRLQVQDQGPGVPAGQRSRMFEPYERLERDQASERTGSGLGLAVVRQIAGACRGTVWLEDAPGGGTRAVLELGAAGPA